MTGQSLLSKFGAEAAQWSLRLLEEGLAHFVASEAHDLVHRPPRLNEAKRFAAAQFNEEYADLLFVSLFSGKDRVKVGGAAHDRSAILKSANMQVRS